MLEVNGVSVSIKRAEILRGVNLAVPEGGFVALVGRNGAGKTTLMRATIGLIGVSRGRISLDGRDLTHTPAHERARLGVGYMPEDRRLVAQWSVEDNILLPTRAQASPDGRERLDRVFESIPEVRAMAKRRANQLSGGQQKLVALARAIVCGSRLLLLDEPFEGIAPALAVRLTAILSDLRKEQRRSVLVSESDLRHTRELVDSVFLIDRGIVRAQA